MATTLEERVQKLETLGRRKDAYHKQLEGQELAKISRDSCDGSL
jgi:hypothetical protein